MIKVNLFAVGKVKEEYFAKGIGEYSKRLGKFCDFRIVEIKEEALKGETDSEIARALRAEGANIKRAIKGEYYVFSPDGAETTSEGFSELISSVIDEGKEVNFVIGSSYGLSDEVRSGAKGRISFSKMTFPHTLFRLCACEQIYRAFTIITGATYHK